MVEYVKVSFANLGVAYQEVSGGSVQRYRNEDGVELFVDPPVGEGCAVIDANPARPSWDGTPLEFTAEQRGQALAEAPADELVKEIGKRTLSEKALTDLQTAIDAKKG